VFTPQEISDGSFAQEVFLGSKVDLVAKCFHKQPMKKLDSVSKLAKSGGVVRSDSTFCAIDPQPFGISAADQRQHLYVTGKTGSGKTTKGHRA
jgi:hypothetical protein